MSPDPEKKIKISAVILARNEEANIAFCLNTLEWCDEVVVVDMESADRTAEIARQRGAIVFSHLLTPVFDTAKKFAVEKSSGEWILLIDADEMVPKSLADALSSAAERGKADIVRVPFNHYILGEVVRHSGWGFTPQPRFFRKGKVVFSDKIHGYFREAEGASSEDLPLSDENCIRHFNYVDSSHFVEKLNRYTDIEALHLYESGARFSALSLLRTAASEFYRRFFLSGGYRGGPRGFSLCLMMAFYRVLSHIKLWEKNAFSGEPVRDIYRREREAVLKGWGK